MPSQTGIEASSSASRAPNVPSRTPLGPDLAPSDFAMAAVQEAIQSFIRAHLAGEFPDTKVRPCDVCQADERHHRIMAVHII